MQGVAGEVSGRVRRAGGPRTRREGMRFERTLTRLCLFLPFPVCKDGRGEKNRTMVVMTMMIIMDGGRSTKERVIAGFRKIKRGARRKQGGNNCDNEIDEEGGKGCSRE